MNESVPNRPKAISVGVIVGGVTAQSKVWREALTRLSKDRSGISGQLESDFRINFEFQVPGHITSPDFQGVRSGTFRKADRHLKTGMRALAVVSSIRHGHTLPACRASKRTSRWQRSSCPPPGSSHGVPPTRLMCASRSGVAPVCQPARAVPAERSLPEAAILRFGYLTNSRATLIRSALRVFAVGR